jgi:hypothetical protein
VPNSATGLLAAFGTAEETVYGTAVAPDKWVEILTDGIELRPVTLQSEGLYAGTITGRRGSRRARTRRDAGGQLTMEVPTTGFGRFLKHIVGGTPSIAQQGGTAAWLQTHVYGSVAGKSLTMQGHRRDGANALVQQFTRVGCKIPEAEFSINKDSILQCAMTVDARDENVSTAAGTPSYSNNAVFTWTQGAISLGGTPLAKVTDAKWKFTRPMKTDGYYLGSAGLKSEPTENAKPSITGSLALEFDSTGKTAIYDPFVLDSALSLVLTFTGANIAGAYYYNLTFTFPEIHLLGETPKIGGPDVAMMNPNFEAASDSGGNFCTVNYQSTDTAIT